MFVRRGAGHREQTNRGGFLELNSPEDVLREQLADLYSVEMQLIQALPKMAQASGSQALREVFEDHLEETRNHVCRLDDIYLRVGVARRLEVSVVMRRLIEKAEEIIDATGDPAALDSALILAAQCIEHCEIAAYCSAKTLADGLGYEIAKSLLDATLQEEGRADRRLTRLATGGHGRIGINREAAQRAAFDRSGTGPQ